MHATIEQLIEIKDGLDNPAAAHVKSCQVCQGELAQLQSISQSMYDSANQAPPADMWAKIQASAAGSLDQPHSIPRGLMEGAHLASAQAAASVSSPASNFNWSSLSTAVYTLALSVLVTGLISLYTFNQQSTSRQQTEMLQASIEQLMLNSRGLESVLQRVAAQSESLDAAETKLAERLYWRLQYVDQMINNENAGDDQVDAERIKALWGDRISALNQLNQLYYGRQPTFGNRET